MNNRGDQTTLRVRLGEAPAGTRRPRRYPVLIGLAGAMRNKRFTLGRERVTLGRSAEADIPIEDNLVSRFHSSILYINFDRENEIPDCRMFDEKSTNGTFVNGAPVDAEGIWLADRDRIEIGKTVFGFFIRDEEELTLDDRIEAEAKSEDSST